MINFADYWKLLGNFYPWSMSCGKTPAIKTTPVITPDFCDSFEYGLGNWVVNAGASGDTPYVSVDDTLENGLLPVDGSYVAYLGDSTI